MTADRDKQKFMIRQLGLAASSSLGLFTVGLIRGFSSPGIPSMKNISPHLVSSEENIAWTTSVSPLGATLGSIVAWPLLRYFGRKTVLQGIGPVFALTWIGLSLSDSFPLIIFFRYATGFCAGVVMPAGQVYVSEATDPMVRGLMASLPALVMALGVLIQYIIGTLVEWRTMAWMSAIAPAALLPALIPFPDSPAWLRLRGKSNADEARKWYGLQAPEKENLLQPQQKEPLLKALRRRAVLEPFLLALGMLVFQQTCGNDVVMFNAVLIFKAAGSTMDPHIAGIFLGIFHFVFVFLSIFIVDRWGRRPLLMFSATLMGVGMTVLSVHFWISPEPGGAIGFIPVAAMLGYIAAFSLGFGTVPFVLVGEIIPLAQRSALGPASTATGLLFMFLELKTYPDLAAFAGTQVAFAVYAFFNFLSVFVVYIYLPETKGKSLEEIEEYFKMKESSKKILRNDPAEKQINCDTNT